MNSVRWVAILALAMVAGRAVHATPVHAAAKAAGPVAKPSACVDHRVDVAAGDSAYSILRRSGIAAGDAMRWLAPTHHGRSLRDLHAGDVLTFCTVGTRRDGIRLAAVGVMHRQARMRPSLESIRAAGTVRETLVVKSSLEHALRERRVSWHLVDAVHAYLRDDRDLPARLPRGTRVVATFSGNPSQYGARLLCLDVELHGRRHRLFHYVDAHGRQYVLGDHGHGVRILAMEKPLRHARISSGWGWRINPVLKRREFHKGIDYAAPLGTPIRAALAGVVEIAAWHGNYGRMVDVHAASSIDNRYGHLSRFAAGIRPGVHVRAGQVIGYVGATGLATGPHLYFELWERHRRVDPLIREPVTTARLDGRARRRFAAFIRRLDA